MKNMSTKSTRTALLTSVMALFLCVAMLTGTTFAWFTDSVESGKNTIVAGNLDVELYHTNANEKEEQVTKGVDDLFPIQLWEPGVATYENFTIKNEGTLAFNYLFDLKITGFNTTSAGKSVDDALKVALVDTAFAGTREDLKAVFAGGNGITFFDSIEDVMLLGKLEAGAEKSFAVILYWEPSAADNDFNMNNNQTTSDSQPLFVEVAVSLLASQLNKEQDSFGPDYDENAPQQEATNPSSLQTALNLGGQISLTGTHSDLSINVPKDATLILEEATLTGTFTIHTEAGATLTLKDGKTCPMVVTGDGAVALNNVITNAAGTGASALTVAAATTYSLRAAAAEATVKIVIDGAVKLQGDKGHSGIYVPAGITLDLSGTGVLSAVGNGGAEYAANGTQYSTTTDASYATGGHGIGGEGVIYIHDLAGLSAEGYGKHGCGIGGNASAITIKDTKIDFVRGGFLNQTGEMNDAIYTKSEPEGGAAIGGYNNACVITLDGVTVKEALGGSKAAGIGAGYHTSTTVVITGSTIDKVVGGPSSAGIGGARVKGENANEQVTSITIQDSKINAVGGYYGAGIGSGYDTHCPTPDKGSKLTLNIKGSSVITAIGGKYAAGIGTGYHNGNMVGEIEQSVVVNASQPAEFWYKAAYTAAMDVGFGVIDPAREGLNNTSSIKYLGKSVTIPKVNAETNEIQTVTDGLTYYNGTYFVANANGLKAVNNILNKSTEYGTYTAVTVKKIVLTANIDFTGYEWKPVDIHADTVTANFCELNGNGYIISNLTVNGQAMFTRFANSGTMLIKDLTFDHATVNSNGKINTSILTVQTYQNTMLLNVDVKNSSITGGYKVAPLIATVHNESSSTITLTVKDCDVSDTTVTATAYDFCTTGMVAFVYEDDNDKVVFENCTVTKVTLNCPDSYDAHAFVYTAGSETLYNEVEGVVVTDCTVND